MADNISLSKLQEAFHEYVTDFKTQHCMAQTVLPQDFVDGIATEQPSVQWNYLTSHYRKDAEFQSTEHAEKCKNYMEKRKLLTEFFNEHNQSILDKVCEIWTDAKIDTCWEEKTLIDCGSLITLMVEHPVIVLSKILPHVEDTIMKNPLIRKVHFKAEYVFYIDTSIEKSRWHGISIHIVADKIECIFRNIHFDVSGNDATSNTLKASNGKTAGKNGCRGEDGAAGENGGNIKMISNAYVGMSNLSIYSNGGNGANGQDGGDGCDGLDGTDGKSFALKELKECFSSPLATLRLDEDQLKKSIRYLRTKSKHLETIEQEGFNEKGCMMNKKWFSENFIYYKGILETNIQYEYCLSLWKTGGSFYAFFMGENGSQGTPGGVGGIGGAPGKPGTPGSIKLVDVSENEYIIETPRKFQISANKGIEGNLGQNGKDGKMGNHGVDVAIVDHTGWFFPVYYSGNRYHFEKSHSKTAHTAVYCSKHKFYRRLEQDSGVVTR